MAKFRIGDFDLELLSAGRRKLTLVPTGDSVEYFDAKQDLSVMKFLIERVKVSEQAASDA